MKWLLHVAIHTGDCQAVENVLGLDSNAVVLAHPPGVEQFPAAVQEQHLL